MTDAFNQQGGVASPTGGNTEFERSIARSADSQDTGSRESTAAGLRERLDEDLGTVKKAAENVTQKVTDKASEVAERQKGYAAEQIGKFAEALEKVGDELQSSQPGPVGDYTKRLGSSARDFAERMRDKDIGQIAAVAEDFGRRQPLAFLGLAAIAGLAASRFLMASADTGQKTASAASSGTTGASSPYPGMKESYNG